MCTSSGVHSQNGSQQPGDHNLESLLVVRLALAGSGELSYSCSSKLAPSICALARGFLLSPCRCSLQGCLSKSDAAWDRSCQQNVTFEFAELCTGAQNHGSGAPNVIQRLQAWKLFWR